MVITALTEDELGAYAFLFEQRRNRTAGATVWDRPGIVAALRKLRDVDELVVHAAGLAAAADPKAETPTAIGWPQYRGAAQHTPASAPSREPVCDICNEPRARCQLAQRNQGQPDHDFQPPREGKRS